MPPQNNRDPGHSQGASSPQGQWSPRIPLQSPPQSRRSPGTTPRQSRGVLGFIFGLAVGILTATAGFVAWNMWAWGVEPSSDFNSHLPKNLDYASVEEIYDQMRAEFDGPLNKDQLLTSIKKGLVAGSGDPNSAYYSSVETRQLFSDLEGELVGIGVRIHRRGAYVVIVTPVKGAPAEKAGVQSGDVILQVDEVHVTGKNVAEVAALLSGDEGTTVVLRVHRRGADGTWADKTFTLKRAKISVPSVIHEVKDGVGILQITQFNLVNSQGEANTIKGVERAVKDFRRQNIKGLVLDLRGNPGGDLVTVSEVANYWLREGQTIFKVGDHQQGIESVEKAGYSDLPEGYQGSLAEIPMVILVDRGSASASEILLMALLDNGYGSAIGQPTYGKVTIQRIFILPGDESLRLTVEHWYAPKGRRIDGGYKPPVSVVDDPETTEVDEVVEKALQMLQ